MFILFLKFIIDKLDIIINGDSSLQLKNIQIKLSIIIYRAYIIQMS